MIIVKGNSMECFKGLATTKLRDYGIWLVSLFSYSLLLNLLTTM